MQDLKIRFKKRHIWWSILFYILLFRNPLGRLHGAFSYADELLSLIGPIVLAYRVLVVRKMRVSKYAIRMFVLIALFVAVGLSGNLLYNYQPAKAVLTDLYTNLKFFFAIITGYVLFYNHTQDGTDNHLVNNARFASLVLILLMAASFVFPIFPASGYRYGIRVSDLFFTHSTYLAAAAVFLAVILTMFYRKGNQYFILMDLVLLASTLRAKAFASIICYLLLFVFVIMMRRKLHWWHIAMIGILAIVIAWDQFYYYYVELSGESARSVLTATSIQIMKDYFPIGTGFGTYASNAAAEYYSPVYFLYDLASVYGLRESGTFFSSDTFWPIIFGQTGILGTILFVSVLGVLILQIIKIRKHNRYAYAAGLFVFAYLILSSTSESAFHNPLAIPLAITLGFILAMDAQHRKKSDAI